VSVYILLSVVDFYRHSVERQIIKCLGHAFFSLEQNAIRSKPRYISSPKFRRPCFSAFDLFPFCHIFCGPARDGKRSLLGRAFVRISFVISFARDAISETSRSDYRVSIVAIARPLLRIYTVGFVWPLVLVYHDVGAIRREREREREREHTNILSIFYENDVVLHIQRDRNESCWT